MAYNNKSAKEVKKAILTTIIYSDLFDFPLTKDELWEYLFFEKARDIADKNLFEKMRAQLIKEKQIEYYQPYYCLTERRRIIEKRIKNRKEVEKKMKIAKEVAEILSKIPTVYGIGISGGLAVQNVGKNDDIDFFIIAKKNTLLVTRFWILVILELLGKRRKRKGGEVANKICVNLLLDESALDFFTKEKDIYTAHEIAQLIPLFERNNTINKFFKINNWINTFLPNSKKIYRNPTPSIRKNQNPYFIKDNPHFSPFIKGGWEDLTHFLPLFVSISCLPPISFILEQLQFFFIKKHKKKETITRHVLTFYPKDYKTRIIEKLRTKQQQFGLLTKN